MQQSSARPSFGTYVSLFVVTLTTLTYEILLTRIFSVTMWYHFAFMAISVAMFGMAFGAILVYLAPRFFAPEHTRRHLAWTALGFAIAVPTSLAVHLLLPFVFDSELLALAATYVAVALPFAFSGTCVCLALTRFPHHVGRLYAADLLGAALGCLVLVALLELVDAPSAVLLVAGVAALGAFGFSLAERAPALRAGSMLVALALLSVGGVNAVLSARQQAPIRLFWAKGAKEERPFFEKWNSLARISVLGHPRLLSWPVGWGLSSRFKPEKPIRQLQLQIDSHAGTVLTGFDGRDMEHLEHLRYDISNLVHYIRSDGRVCVIGVGGGRDVLSALLFGQREVLAIDLNREILDLVTGRFAGYTGHLDRDPRVTFVHDEARSYISRTPEKYDVIQASLVDTFTASSAGAYVLSEHSIYTVEAWTSFLEHLTPRGVLTFTRFYTTGLPGETHRLASLASAALARIGVKDPERHIVVVKNSWAHGSWAQVPGTGGSVILVGRQPFTATDLDTIETVSEEMDFDILASPRGAQDAVIAALASGGDLHDVAPDLPVDMSAPHDDRPFFFFLLKPSLAFSPIKNLGHGMANSVRILVTLLVVVVALTVLCIFLPLMVTTRRGSLRGAAPLLVFFAAIGTGFMLVEISQLQRLSIFLGHPTYGLTVVLFALLLSSGIGSRSVHWRDSERGVTASRIRLVLLVGVLALSGMLTPLAIDAARGGTLAVRVATAVATLLPMGFLMGMAVPMGLLAAGRRHERLSPWLWGVNGATSVCASVVALVLALALGISATYWIGVACYVVAVTSFWFASRGITASNPG